MITVYQARDAMATRFEAWLVGDDREHLEAVAAAALDEVARVEQLLSRFDPRSELWRINRYAADEPVLVDVEMFGILHKCLWWYDVTGGYFDIAAAAESDRSSNDVALDESRRTVRFLRPGVKLDLGGFGKGYALDCATEVLSTHGVTRGLLHGGTSSVLARGADKDDRPWRVGLRSPSLNKGPATELAQLELHDRALSTSAVLADDRLESDIVDPHTHRPITAQAACTVVSRSAAEAEILSTTLLSMGKASAAAYIKNYGPHDLTAAWIEVVDATPRLEWLTGELTDR